MAGLTIRTLGGLSLSGVGGAAACPMGREAALLVYVAYSAPRIIPRDHLAEVFWPESSQARARHSVSQAIYRLSRRVPGLSFRVHANGVAVDSATLSLDAFEFREDVLRREYAAAGELYGGPFLAGFTLEGAPEFEDWVDRVRGELASLAERAFRAALAAAEEKGDWSGAEHAAEQLLRLDPHDQAAAATQISLLAEAGGTADARRRLRALVAELESASEPISQRLRDLSERLSQDREVDSTARSEFNLPLIGRTNELSRLKSALAAAQNGVSHSAFVTGEGGLGKTRLVQQLARLAALRGFRVFAGNCMPLVASVPYAVARQMLSGLRAADLETLPSASINALAHLVPDSLLPPRGGFAAGLPRREWLYDSLSSLLRSICRRSPVFLLIEDIHWVDQPSAELFRHLMSALQGERVFLLATARPEEITPGSDFARSLAAPPTLQLGLKELSVEAIDALIAAFAAASDRHVAADLAAEIKRKAGGHPFFTLELLQHWRSGQSGDGAGAGISLPASIEQFLGRRFEGLTPAGRSVAEALAVLGRSAGGDAVATVAGLDGEAFADGVDELCVKGLVQESGDQVVFKHDLVREAAYARLNLSRRRMLHARAVRALRGKRGADPGALAVHSAMTSDSIATCRFAVAAANVAERRFGHAEAEPYWQLAAEHASGDLMRRRCALGLANCWFRLDRHSQAAAAYSQLLLDPRLPAEVSVLARARQVASAAHLGQLRELPEHCASVLYEAKRLPLCSERTGAAEALLFAIAVRHRVELVSTLVSEISGLIGPAPVSDAKVRCLGLLIQIATFAGEWERAREWLAELCKSISGAPPYWPLRFRSLLGVVEMQTGHLRAAEKEFSEVERVAIETGQQRTAADVGNAALLKLELARFSEAEELFSKAVAWARIRDARYIWAVAESNLALSAYETGLLDEAIQRAERAEEIGGVYSSPASFLLARAIRGLIALKKEVTGELEVHRTALLERISEPYAGADLSYAEIFLARMSERDGDVPGALERLERSIQFYAGRDFFCHGRLELEKARLIGLSDPAAGLALARQVRGRAADAEGVLLLNKAEALIRDLKRAAGPTGANRVEDRRKAAEAATTAKRRRGARPALRDN